MGIQINGQTDTITAIDGALTVSGAELSAVTNLNATGIVTASGFVGNITGNVNATGVSTIATLNVTQSNPTNLNVSGVTTTATLRATSIVGVTTAGITTAYIGSVNDGPLSGARNRIINGDCRIDQRYAGASITVSGDPQYTLDRWYGARGTVPNFTAIRSGSAPVGFTSSYLITMGSGTAPGTSGYASIGQRIEGFNTSDLLWGTANAKPVTLSFWVNCSVSGTFGVSFRNNNADTTYCTTYTINSTNTWEYKTVTVPGVTTGTWFTDNRWGIEPVWDLGVGTQYSGTAGQVNSGSNYFGVTGTTKLSSTTGATFYITGVQLESGTVGTPFERRSYGQELALCQRYYQQSNPLVAASALYNTNTGYVYQPAWNYSGSNGIVGQVRLPVVMRAAPTIAIYVAQGQTTSAGKLNIYQGSWQTADAGIEGTGAQSFNVNNTNTGTTGNTLIQFHYTASIEL
jgi:hypothetical protein